jgi:hypothetical protein
LEQETQKHEGPKIGVVLNHQDSNSVNGRLMRGWDA